METNDILKQSQERIKALRNWLDELRRDYQFQSEGGKIFYAADFSELHEYLQLDSEESAPPDKRGWQGDLLPLRPLATAHLFNSFGDSPIQMLKPHLQELWEFVQVYRELMTRTETLRIQARGILANLEAEKRRELEAVVTQTSLPHDTATIDRIVTFVRSAFGEVLLDVTEMMAVVSRTHGLGRLKKLLEKKRLSVDLDALVTKHLHGAIPALEDEQLEFQVFDAFDPKQREGRRYQKLLDAQALVLLKRLNEALHPYKVKIVLITRDAGILDAVAEMAAKRRDWSLVHDDVRKVECVALDMLVGHGGEQQRRETLDETDEQLRKVEKSIERLLATVPMFGQRELASRLLRDVWRAWEEYMNLRLSLAVRDRDWLNKTVQSGDASAPQTSNQEDTGLILLRRLWEFMNSEAYYSAAEEGVRSALASLHADAMRMLFLGILGEQRTDQLIAKLIALDSDRQSNALSSKLPSFICTIELTSGDYRQWLAELKAAAATSHATQILNKTLTKILQRATTDRKEAESFFFMAFVLGTLGFWEDAYEIARYSSSLEGKILRAEVEYFSAVALRRVAMNSVQANIDKLATAYDHVMQAIRLRDRQDARFIKERATLALEYSSRVKGRSGSAPALSSGERFLPLENTASKAVPLLEESLRLATDVRLRIEILNNLAYEALNRGGTPSVPKAEDLQRAIHFVDELDKIFKPNAPGSWPPIPPPWPAILETVAAVRGAEAFAQRDEKALQQQITTLKSLRDSTEVSGTERTDFTDRIDHLEGLSLLLRG